MGVRCPKCHSENPDTSQFCADCGAELLPKKEISVSPTETLEKAKEELTTGSTFAGRYQIIEELGKGGMGKVYKANDTEIKEKVALKLIKPEIASDKKTIERFRNELKFARKIRHNNVCQMYDLNKEEGNYYITMEYVSGEDLKSLIRRVKQLTVGTTISIAKQICEGLAEAHRLGVVHRDLKPSNIMIDKEGNARIMDFGIARSLKAKGVTAEGMIIGTPEYMSPEQAEAKEIDQRSDIYSLGVILYEMVTGRVPFIGETPLSIAMKHKSERPINPREINTQIPQDLSRLILRCMEKEKEKRNQSADELLSDLAEIERKIPTAERIVPKRKPITAKEITVTFGLKKLFIPATVAIVLIISAVIIWQFFPKKEAVTAPSDKPSLAIMYFKNNTGDKNLDHWKTMLSNLLIADLAQSKHIRVLSESRLFKILSQVNQLEAETYSSEVLEQIAAQGKVDHILLGAYAKAGDEFRINIMLHDAKTQELLGSESAAGIGEESIFSVADELTRKIKANFKLSEKEIAKDVDKEAGKITTRSPEAFKYYNEAIKYANIGEPWKAIEFYEKAVDIDPEFAMAYRGMATAYRILSQPTKRRVYLKKAFELSDRLPDKERYSMQADFYSSSEKTYEKAIEAYEELLHLYPEDFRGNYYLAHLYLDLEEWDKAIELFEVLVRNKEKNDNVYGYQSLAYSAKGLYDKSRKVEKYYINNIQDISHMHWGLGVTYMVQGKHDLALEEENKALSLDPNYWPSFGIKGDIYLYSGNLIKAEEEYRKLLEVKNSTAYSWGLRRLRALYLLQGRYKDFAEQSKKSIKNAEKVGEKNWERSAQTNLSKIELISGNPEQALNMLNNVWGTAVEDDDLGWQRKSLHLKGLTYLEMNLMDDAQRIAGELKELIEQGLNKKAMRLYFHLNGMIELKKEDFTKATEYFNKAISLLPFQSHWSNDTHAVFFESLALAYFMAGNLERAREEYEKTTSLTTGRLEYGDIYAKSLYKLGKIYEKKGWEGKAIENYEKFLELWKDAEPGIAEFEDANKRLAALKSQ